MLRADNPGVTPSARYAWRSSGTSITFSTYSITCIKSCHSKESLIDVRDDFLLRLHGVSLFLASFWVLLLIDSLSITLFLCASLGPGAFPLAHCGSCLVDHGRLDAFTASFTVAISPQRSSALFCILSRVLAETREYASCARCESSFHHRLSLKAVSPFIKSKTIHAVFSSASGLAVSED